MVIYRTIEEIPGKFPHAVVTVGNFDGVHLGHRAIFKKISQSAAESGGVSVVVTFAPHPLKVLAAERDFRLITTYAEKERLIAESGIDVLVIVPFTREFSAVPAEVFVRNILVGSIGMRSLVVGFDYVFGRNREGNVSLLRRLGEELGFTVDVLDQVGNSETGFSSSMVREMISAGDVRGVLPLLGRYFSVGGEVVHGFHRGKQLGFPTANIEVEEDLLPKPGVYAVKVEGDGWVCDGACNIGNNPTFYGSSVTVEAHLLDFDADLYGSRLRVYFVERVRDEREFTDVFSLQEAIRNDVARCRELLANVSLIRHHE
ncbi:MAG: bifunctional riboflavin kinase/FAD synthetase [Geobacter sp.]|nr:MAG: bifunctional riboflavin kinase/FAD synthetase [Geobacter sp.]